MRDLIDSIVDRNFVEADSIISEAVELIMAKKLEEAKKMCAAKMTEQQGHVMNRTSSQLTRLGVVEEEEIDEINTSYVNYQGGSGSSSVYTKTTRNPFSKGTEVLADKFKQNVGGTEQSIQRKTTVNNLGNNNQSVKTSSSMSTVQEANDPAERTNLPVEKGTPKQLPNTTVINKNNLGGPGSTHYKNMKEEEAEQLNELTPIARKKYVDAVNAKPGIFKGIRRSSLAGIEGDKQALETQIERSKKDSRQSAWSTSDLKRAHKNLETKHERRKNIADKVAAGLKESANQEELDESRINIVKARIRGGKIQRRKKVSNVAGMTFRSGKLQRMSTAERRRRKMGARKAVRKRAPKMNRALMKRKRSLMKRRALGL